MKYRVSFEFRTPDVLKATQEQVEEWVKYVVGYSGSLKGENPLANEDFDPVYGSLKVVRVEE